LSQVVVLGGGPAGLYAALLLARRGIEATVIEREQHPGGLTAGTEVGGIRVDYGSHRLHPSIDPSILADLKGILGDELQVRRRNGRINLDGAWISFPLSFGEMATKVRPSTLVSLARGAAVATVTPSQTDTFADVVRTGLGKAMGDLFYFPYARKIWGVGPEELSGEQARRRISADSPVKLIRKALSGNWGREFFYPKEGFGQIASGLAQAATASGATIRLGETATAITGSGDEWEVVTDLGPTRARLLLSTVPITVLARLFAPPKEVAKALESLHFRSMVLVYLTVPMGQWTPYDAHYFPGADVLFTRVSEPKNYRDGSDPEDRTVLCAEIPCDFDDTLWQEADESLIQRVRADLVRLGLPDPGATGEVRRLRFAYPIYRVGSEVAFETVSDWLDEASGVVTFGRQGLFAHDNTHHAMAMARDAVACISPDLEFDAAAWGHARERFARHVVED
jgi:protoporphyrinogen oxidase